MAILDWLVVAAYLAGLFALALWSSRKQQSHEDYYLAGNKLSSLSLAISTIATQCSTNSLLGAPAFVGFAIGGGMLWLQYELAVPLAMLALMFLLLPIRAAGHVSVYGFLEERLGSNARRLASGSFLLIRGIATGVTVYGAALVLGLLLELSYTASVLILMGITIAYDLLGGLRAVVISDVVQMLLIVIAVLVSLIFLNNDIGEQGLFDLSRATTISLDAGLTSGENYGLWPMLFGGFFLYCAYYGCDQSQAQRVLAAKSPTQTARVLVFNGVLRFPVVLLYCLLGLALSAYASQSTEFLDKLPTLDNGSPNINLVFPSYVLERFPVGLVGLVMVGVFAAAMSSIDSALNSLSAASVEDFWRPTRSVPPTEKQALLAGRLTTLFWGVFAVFFSYQVENIAPTVLEAINKIGSMINGPLLGLFAIALLFARAGQSRAIFAFFAGLLVNFGAWLWLPDLSWLWWNPLGFVTTFGIGAFGLLLQRSNPAEASNTDNQNPALTTVSGAHSSLLVGMFALILIVCILIDRTAVLP